MKSHLNTQVLFSLRIKLLLLFFIISNAGFYGAIAQDKQYVKIKAFDETLKPYGNIKIGINQGSFTELNDRGTAFTNLDKKDFPIKSIEISDDMLEAASWNLSKGVLEITIREKSYKDVTVIIKNLDNEVLSRQPFTFKGTKTITSTTSSDGSVSLPLALNEKITNANQFTLKKYKPISINTNGAQYELKVALLKQPQKLTVEKSQVIDAINGSRDLKTVNDYNLDSIRSIPELYKFLTEVDLSELSREERNKIDERFNELFAELAEGQTTDSTSFITNITDSTIVENDLRNLLKEVRQESKRLNLKKSVFDTKIALIREKLKKGFKNLDDEARAELLNDLNLLEELLASNKSEFIENQSIYLDMIADLKTRFFDIEKLEGELGISEQKRLEEKKRYQQRILAISGVVILFALMLIVLLYLRKKLKKQQKQLILAHNRVKEMNQNLENIVAQRTSLLEKTYKELDMVLYRASHDLRGPLCSITGLSNLIALNTNNDELTDLIIKTNNKMDRLLKKLSTISEIHQPGTHMEVNVAGLVQEVIQRFDDIRKLQKTDLIIHCDPELTIVSIPYLIEVIIHSLIENALFYSDLKQGQDSKVSLKINRKNNRLSIEVYDNGIGIDKSSEDKLFDMFYIGTEFSKGNGLGLYIVQKSVNLLKGDISVRSKLGEYTRIVVSVPLDNSKKGDYHDFIASKRPVLN